MMVNQIVSARVACLALAVALAAVGNARAANLVVGGDFTDAASNLSPLARTNGGKCELAQEEGSWNRHGRLVLNRTYTNESGVVKWQAVAVIGSDGTSHGIPVTPGRYYDFSLELKGSCSKVDVNPYVWTGTGSGFWSGTTVKCVGSVPISSSWKQVRGSFQAPEGCDRAGIGLQLWASSQYPPVELQVGDTVDFDNLVIDESADDFDSLGDRAFSVAQIPVDSDYSVPFVPREVFHPSTNIAVKGAVNERVGVPIALLNLTDSDEEYVVRLETDTSDPAKPYAEKQYNGTWGLKDFPPRKVKARVAVKMKDTDTEPVTRRLEQLPRMNEACTLVVQPKEAGVVWFDFDLKDATPGTYRGRLRVIPLGQASTWTPYLGVAYHERVYSGKMLDIPFSLEVRPIVLARDPQRPLGFFQSADSDGMFGLMYDVGARNFMISPYSFVWAKTSDGQHLDFSQPGSVVESLRLSVNATKARMARRGGHATFLVGFSAFEVFRSLNNLSGDFDRALLLWPEYLAGVKACMNAWGVADADYAIEVYDEPDPANIENIDRVLRAAKESVPAVRLFLTLGARCPSAEQLRTLDPSIDGWILWRGGYFSNAEYLTYISEALAAGKEVWHYTCNTSGSTPIYSNYRLHAWFGWRHGLTGNQFFIFQEQTGGFGPADFKVAMSAGIVYKSFDWTIPSLRYMAMRRGAEDVKYLDVLAQHAADVPEVQAFLATAAVRAVETELYDTTAPDRIREEAAALILKHVPYVAPAGSGTVLGICAHGQP